jgi:hypothetical protein
MKTFILIVSFEVPNDANHNDILEKILFDDHVEVNLEALDKEYSVYLVDSKLE